MREIRTSGSVGAPGGKPPGATRSSRFIGGSRVRQAVHRSMSADQISPQKSDGMTPRLFPSRHSKTSPSGSTTTVMLGISPSGIV